MPTKIYALKDYEPPTPAGPPPDLTTAEVDKVKARIRILLTPGPGAGNGDEFVPGPMEDWKLLHHTCHEVRHIDGISTITASQVEQVLIDMSQGGEFKEGMGKIAAVAEPLPK